WAVPMILSWFEVSKVPTVIVEIIMGVIIGPSVLDLLGDTPHLDFLSQTGFLFLIFLSGLALDIDKIISSLPKKIRKVDMISNSFIVANIIYFGSLLLSWPASWVVSLFFEIDIIFFTILFPTVALSIIVPILKNDGELNRKFGQIILMVGAIATIMSIILISIYSGVLQKGFQTELLLFLVIFVVFFACYFVGKQLVKITLFKQIMYTLEHAASQIRIRGSIAILLFFIVIADVINTEPVLGAFFAGTLLSMFLAKERSALLFKLDGMGYGFFIPIFFIMVGVNLDLSAMGDFGQSVPFVLVLLAATFLTQMVPTYLVTSIFGIKKTTAAGLLLSSRMGLMIATAQIGISLGIIGPAANAAIVITAIISSVLSPFLYKFTSVSGQKQFKLFIIGGNKTAGLLGERLKMHGVDAVVITANQKSYKLFLDKGLNA
ncbi:cation:proton antiporter, partial [Fulvivirga sp. RKSG066]|uniref:cation:proton antiporter n=1 Tax=Fulvivirga aurantia TaxID=2529383 RepID=UPI0012BB4DAC